ncbi:MAG TPA: type I secretion system permease/ATPase [Novosphingobium sp.]|uniref:type I secretion system permease/ATPase n=1 Tax=Rhizorhapis sp. TaxID=1968842 RepID=UPI002B48A281|nr:type I secretion system permease/ATPase [Rhizorhapis sp.]HKR16884.1 type I secretion system permease/ATPase [Rhizorhapis sp.]HKX78719.1 type I secretion system permease/ATPase [Novosphingobium sp.]
MSADYTAPPPEPEQTIGLASDESGLVAFAALLAMHRIAVDPAQLRHSLGHYRAIESEDLLRLAKMQGKEAGIRARSVRATFEKLERMPVPALANGPNGWFLIGRVQGGEALIQLALPQAGADGSAIRKVDRAALEAMWSGELVLLTTRENVAGQAGKFDVTWFIPQIVKYRRLIGEVLLITLALNLLGLAAPLFFQNVVDKVLVHDTLDTLTVLAIGYVAVSLWETAFGWLRTRLYSRTSQKIDVELGARLFRHLLGLPIGYFEARRVGDIAMRVRQLETIREFLTNASLTVLVDPVFTVVFLAVMWIYSVKLFVISVLTIPAYIAVALFVTRPLQARIEEKFERSAANNALLVESIGGIQTVKAGAVEPQWQERWERQLAGYSMASQRVIDLGNSGSQLIQLISKLNLAAILYFGAGAVIHHQLTVGGLVAFNMFAQRVSGPVIRMAQLWQDFQQVRIAIARLGDVLNQPTEPGAGSRTALPAIRGDITFDGVKFRYSLDGPWTLDDIDLVIPAGTSLGIVGSSGSGKSTLTKLLQRLYVPQGGRILIDGVDIAQIDPAWLRRQIGVVLQENLLFNRSIRENIALANPAMPLEAVVEAATLAGAHEFIVRLPQGYDTVVEERGANLSGGQRQRLAIARALVTRPRILILDEATSALDAESEEIIQNNLKAMSAGRTVLIIAHRLSAVRQCDHLIALEAGRIVERGSHDELLRAGGRYADLHRRQTGLAMAGLAPVENPA